MPPTGPNWRPLGSNDWWLIVTEITLRLNDQDALALAQFVKRVGWTAMAECSESEEETYLIRSALGKLFEALREVGYAPR